MRTSIKAKEGYILTNGEIYGSEIFLAEGMREEDFREITREEYEEKLAEEAREMMKGRG